MADNNQNVKSKLSDILFGLVAAFIPFFDDSQYHKTLTRKECGKFIITSFLVGCVCYKYYPTILLYIKNLIAYV